MGHKRWTRYGEDIFSCISTAEADAVFSLGVDRHGKELPYVTETLIGPAEVNGYFDIVKHGNIEVNVLVFDDQESRDKYVNENSKIHNLKKNDVSNS